MTILDAILDWGRRKNEIQAMLLTGSLASATGGDALSDYDIAIYGGDFDFIADDNWLQDIGSPLICIHEKFTLLGFDIPSRLVIFKDNNKVDFSFHPVRALDQIVEDQKLPDDYNIGYRVLLDKTGITTALPPPGYKGFLLQKPAEQEFQNNVREFFFEAWHVVKYLQRNDLWVAMSRQWACLKWLRQLLEWQEGYKQQWNYSPGNEGKKMMRWLEEPVAEQLANCFSRLEKQAMHKAFQNTLQLYRTTARQLANQLHFPYREPMPLVEFLIKTIN